MKIKTYFQTVTEDSANIGEFAESGEYETQTGESVSELADWVCRNFGSLEASSSNFHAGIWYTTSDSIVDPDDGSATSYTIHCDGDWSVEQQLELYNRLIGVD